MNNFLIIFLIIFLTQCSLNKVILHHGVHNLEKKQTKLKINYTNINDITKVIGPPSTKSSFDNDVWIYIERKISTGSILLLGKEKLVTNNILVVEINEFGLLADMKFYDKNTMKNIENFKTQKIGGLQR